ncbi:MAG: hypothetical protein NZ585_04355 [Chloracidobacterium sp.]|nr:hypothetical protein [Chloracidobacterium sp.]MDW8218586.1 hypothetical protein [Acidobacteriota bacterium]
MLLCFIVWLFIFILGSLYGIAAISVFLTKSESIEFFKRQPFVSSFLGVVIIADIALTCSVFMPLRFYHIIAFMIFIGVYFGSFFPKDKLYLLLYSVLGNLKYIVISSVISFFVINVPYSNLSDMAIYHVQIAKYLHDYGLVKGLAFVLLQLGHQSAWFALPPLFEDFLRIHSSLIVGGFSVFISFCQLLRSLSVLLEDPSELCLASYFLLTIPNIHVHIEVTAVEMALNVLIGMTVFCVMKYFDNPSKDTPAATEAASGCPFLWSALLLGIGSLGLKLTGAPIFLLGVYLLVKSYRFHTAGHYLKLGFISVLLVMPRMIAGIITSGCPFYPSSFLHISVPWYIGTDVSQELVQHIIDYGRWDTLNLPAYRTDTNWILPWLRRYTGKSALYLTYIFTATLFIAVVVHQRKFLRAYSALFAVTMFAFLGVLYAFLTAPAPRFILFYFSGLVMVVHFALSKMGVKQSLLTIIASSSFSDLTNGSTKLALTQFVLLVLLAVLDIGFRSRYTNLLLILTYASKVIIFITYYICFSLFYCHHPSLFIVPDTSSLVRRFEMVNINGIIFHQPVNSTCGYGPLPCYSGNLSFAPPLTEIELIDKEKGFAGGLRRRKRP